MASDDEQKPVDSLSPEAPKEDTPAPASHPPVAPVAPAAAPVVPVVSDVPAASPMPVLESAPVPAPEPTVPDETIQVDEIAPRDAGSAPEQSGKRVVLIVLGAIVFMFGGLVTLVLATSRPAHRVGYVAEVDAALLDASSDGAGDGVSDAGSEDAGSDALAASATPKQWRVADLKADPSIEFTEVPLGKRTVLAALAQMSLAKGEATRILQAFHGVYTFEKCQPKDLLVLAKDKDSKKIRGFEYQSSPLEVWQARDESGELIGKKLEFHVEEKKVAVGAMVTSDLRSALQAASIDLDLLNILDDALDGHLELSDVKPGARFRIVATEQRVDGAFLRYSDVLAVEYVAPGPARAPLRVYHLPTLSVAPKEKLTGYYDGKGHQPFHGGFRSPIPFARVTSRFNPHRKHPVLHIVMPHNGVDFAASTGTPVYASAPGTVSSAGNSGPCGNMVQVLHANGLVTAYCHLSRFAAGLHAGQHVEGRQLIGYAGQTGRVTGPHLHFAVKRGERFLDPLALKLDGVRVVPATDRDRFLALRAGLDKDLDAIVLSDVSLQPLPDGGVVDSDAGEGEDELFAPDPLHENP